MRALKIAAVALALLCFSSASLAIEPDKAAHFAVSFGLAYAGADALKKAGLTPLQAELAALGIAFAVGLGKELSDYRFDPNDMAANGAGLLTGFMLHYTLRW